MVVAGADVDFSVLVFDPAPVLVVLSVAGFAESVVVPSDLGVPSDLVVLSGLAAALLP